MRRWLVVVALVVVPLAACSKPKPQPAPVAQVSPCARVADHLVSLMSGATKHPPEATDPLRRVIGQRCDEDRWSVQATSCLLELTSLADGERCQAMLTPAQIEAFQRDSEAATVELRGQLVDQPPQDAAPASPPDASVDAP